jgi:hypothetical protein
MKCNKFVTTLKDPDIERIEVKLEPMSDGVAVVVEGYYVCTIKNDGVLLLHRDCAPSCIATGEDGIIEVETE